MQPRFIVSTGRCGSTLLSSLLAMHPSVLSLSELFASMQPGAFPPDEISAARFWTLLCRSRGIWTLVYPRRLDTPELLYPIDDGRRFNRETGVPPIARTSLAALSDDPDALLDTVEQLVNDFPAGPVGAHYTRLFEGLAQRLGRPVWVERSGGSLRFINDIARHFPGARFAHIHRDGRETSVSMSRHPAYRLYMVREMMLDALGYDPYEVEGERARVPAELEPLLPERLDLRALEAAEIPLERFGRHWSAMILHGTRRLASLPAENVMHLGYERLVADPRGQLARLAEFLRLPEPPPGWLDAASERVRARPPAWPSLPSDERRRLERACAPGQRRLQTLAAA